MPADGATLIVKSGGGPGTVQAPVVVQGHVLAGVVLDYGKGALAAIEGEGKSERQIEGEVVATGGNRSAGSAEGALAVGQRSGCARRNGSLVDGAGIVHQV